YRGLRAYDGADRAAFFGRRDEIDALLSRLRTEPWLVIAGRSGAGKSSLARAGVAPAIAGLGSPARWEASAVAPRVPPLAAGLAPHVGRAASDLEAAARPDPPGPPPPARAPGP